MRFKIGDTVYLKAEIVGFDKSDDTYETCVDGVRRRFWFLDDSVFITKEEMFAELVKPEMLKVGEVWREQHGCHAKIMYLSEDNIFFEFQDRLNSPGSLTIKEFLERFEKVES